MPEGAIHRFDGPGRVRIYQIALRALPAMIAHAYIVIDGDYVALIDTGSGSPQSNADLDAGIAALSAEHGERVGWGSISRIAITHGHIDHCAGLAFVRERSAAPVAAHRLDRDAIADQRAYLNAQAAATARFLRGAGVAEGQISQLSQFFSGAAKIPPGGDVATIVADGDLLDERLAIIHTPGHCAGMVCLRLGDVLFCADQLLATTNPRLTPSHLEPYNGLDFYLASLARVAAEPGIRLGLAGHEAPIYDVYARAAAIRDSHLARLQQIRAACAEPRSLLQLAMLVYPEMRRPSQLLLALQAVAARVEYLEAQGVLRSTGEEVGPLYRVA